jgi:hypothetical protein
MSERQRRGKSGGAGADHGNVTHRMALSHVAIVANNSGGRHRGEKATEQSLSTLSTNKEMRPHCQTQPIAVASDMGRRFFCVRLSWTEAAKSCSDFRPLLKRNSPSPKIPLSFDCHNRVIAPEIER